MCLVEQNGRIYGGFDEGRKKEEWLSYWFVIFDSVNLFIVMLKSVSDQVDSCKWTLVRVNQEFSRESFD